MTENATSTDMNTPATSLTDKERELIAQMPYEEARDKLMADLDAVIAAECPLCGSVMIQSINQPFISKEEEAEASLWSIFRDC